MSKTHWSGKLSLQKGQLIGPFLGGYYQVYTLLLLLLKQLQLAPNKTSECTKCALTYLRCQSKWIVPGCGFHWKWDSSLAVQIYSSYISSLGSRGGDKSFWWWMGQYFSIILQSKQGDFQFISTIGLLLESSNEDSDFGEKVICN